jgi:excisionase family DNA binding protein
MSHLMTVEEVAEYLGLSVDTLYSYRSNGADLGPPAIRIGRRLRWRQTDVDAWIDERAEKARTAEVA